MSESFSGEIKFFNTNRGYGFIRPDDGGKDIFLHATALERHGIDCEDVRPGDKVNYKTKPGRGGDGIQCGHIEFVNQADG